MSMSDIYSTVTCNISCCGKTSLKPSSVMHRSPLISVYSELQQSFVCVWLCTCSWLSSVLPVHLSVCLSNHLALCNPHHKPRKTQLWPMTSLQRNEKTCSVLFSLKKGQSYLPIMPFSQSKLSEDPLNNRSSLINLKKKESLKVQDVFVISEWETNTGCAQKELMEEQEQVILYNKGIFIKL